MGASLAVERKRLAAQQAALEIARNIGGEVPSAPLATAATPAATARVLSEPYDPLGEATALPSDEGSGEARRKRRRGWDDGADKASSAASASMSSARMEEIVKNWVPSEVQLEAMSVEELQRVL